MEKCPTFRTRLSPEIPVVSWAWVDKCLQSEMQVESWPFSMNALQPTFNPYSLCSLDRKVALEKEEEPWGLFGLRHISAFFLKAEMPS